MASTEIRVSRARSGKRRLIGSLRSLDNEKPWNDSRWVNVSYRGEGLTMLEKMGEEQTLNVTMKVACVPAPARFALRHCLSAAVAL